MHYKWHSCVCLTHNKNVKHNVSVTSIKTTFSLINGRDETLFACVFTSQASTHGDETWYASVLHRFYDDDMFEQQK